MILASDTLFIWWLALPTAAAYLLKGWVGPRVSARQGQWLAWGLIGLVLLAGLVVAASGNGTVHQALLAALLAAQARGCEVRLTTRCAEGHIVGQPAALQTAAPGLNPYKARIDLMLHLME